MKNTLYFGDNLDIIKDLHKLKPEGFIDLIYIDPPFNSQRDYNILFESVQLEDTKAQKEAFADTWSNVSYFDTLQEIHEIDLDLFRYLNTLNEIGIAQSAVSYLTTMAVRIYYMHKLLKPTGSFFLHCDPTMSHHLKIICDLVFSSKNFRNEISWKRSQPKSHTSKNFPNCRDVILRYTKSNDFTFNKVYGVHNEEYLKKFYKYSDEYGRRYRLGDLTNPNKNRPNLTYEFLGVTRVWRWTKQRMQKAYDDGLILQSKPGAVPRFKRYLDDMKGQPITDNWDDIEHLHGSHKETLGYPTQKPEALLERIINSSTNEGDLVADFFCGCGTTIVAAEKLKRSWLGVDISHLAIKLVIDRLTSPYLPARAKEIRENIDVKGFPKDIASAHELAEKTSSGRMKFQEWIIEVMLGGVCNPKKTADGGWDGHISFSKPNNTKGTILIEVKSGKVNVKNIREFIQVVNQLNVEIGVFVCFKKSMTKPMLAEARKQGSFEDKSFGHQIPRIQIITVEDLLEGKSIVFPKQFFSQNTFKKATKKNDNGNDQVSLF